MSKFHSPPAKFTYADQYVLRPLELSDVVQFHESVLESLPELKTFMDWAHFPISEEIYLERVIQQQTLYFQSKEYELGMFDLKSGEILVYIGFYPAIRLNPNGYEIGFWAHSKAAGKGYTTLATQIVIALIFECFNGDRIDITHNIENRRSKRVIEKCGFIFEGQLRNYYPEPTEEMLKNGMTPERRVNFYSLIPEDKQDLKWYPQILENITVHPVLGKPFKL